MCLTYHKYFLFDHILAKIGFHSAMGHTVQYRVIYCIIRHYHLLTDSPLYCFCKGCLMPAQGRSTAGGPEGGAERTLPGTSWSLVP